MTSSPTVRREATAGVALVRHPEDFAAERRYILHVLLTEFLGLQVRCETAASDKTEITLDGTARLLFQDDFFKSAAAQWLKPGSLPAEPLARFDPTVEFPQAPLEPEIPVLFGKPYPDGRFVRRDGNCFEFALDIFGACFFLLTRYEEVAGGAWDRLGRFPATASVLWREKLLERPLVNEYLELLAAALSTLWPSWRRKQREFRVHVTHDVDWHLATAGMGAASVVRNVAGDLIRRRSPALAVRRAVGFARGLRGEFGSDPYNTYSFLMRESERRGLRSSFNFICVRTAPGLVDGNYSLEDPWVRSMLAEIAGRGHQLGVHPGFNSFESPAAIAHAFGELRKTAASLGVRQDCWGGRQHYLRWRAPVTWRLWEAAGLDYDSSVGFADRIGFRAGTCYEYPAFDLETHRMLRLRERPLLVMDKTLLSGNYMGLRHRQAGEAANRILGRCKQYSGDFVLLWHNSNLATPGEKRLYLQVLDECVQ